MKVDGYSPKSQEVFDYLSCYCHGCLCMPNRHTTLISRYEETTARLNKIENAGYIFVSNWDEV